MINIVTVTNENQLVKGLKITDLKLQKEAFKWYWVDFENPTSEEAEYLTTFFEFHPLAIEDCLHFVQRPKINFYEKSAHDKYAFFVLHALNKNTYEAEEVDVFFGNDFIVSFHKGALDGLLELKQKVERKSVEELSPVYVLHALIDNLVDNYFPILYEVEDQILMLDDKKNALPTKAMIDRLFEVRSDLVLLRKTIVPMRELLYRIININKLEGIMDFKHYFLDVHDHLWKLGEMVETNRELTSDIRDNLLSVQSHKSNSTMMTLTVITVIFSPLTFIAGVYGMNFDNIPELHYKYGYFIVLGAMFVITAGLIVLFNKKGWFK